MKKCLFTIAFLSFLITCCSAQKNVVEKNIAKKELSTDFGKIRFSEAITGFKLARIVQKKYLYSVHGEPDMKNTTPTTAFFLEPMQFMDYRSGKSYLDEFSAGYGKEYGVVKTEHVIKKETVINKIKIYIITFTTTDKKRVKEFITMAMVSDEKNAVLFTGTDADSGIYTDRFIRTIKSIEL